MSIPSDLFHYQYDVGTAWEEVFKSVISAISSPGKTSADSLNLAYQALFIFRKDVEHGQLDQLKKIFLEYMNWDELPERNELKFLYLLFLDCLASYKRHSDIPFLLDHSCWNVFEFPAYVMFLCRKYEWRELWDACVEQENGKLGHAKELLFEGDSNILHEWEMTRMHFEGS